MLVLKNTESGIPPPPRGRNRRIRMLGVAEAAIHSTLKCRYIPHRVYCKSIKVVSDSTTDTSLVPFETNEINTICIPKIIALGVIHTIIDTGI